MTTEQKIREAYEKYKARTIFPESVCEEDFRAGYLALLNELLPSGDYAVASVSGSTKQMAPTYILPCGVTKS